MNFSVRSYEPELIDNTDLAFSEVSRNMEELRIINKLLGGHRLNVKAIEILVTQSIVDRNHSLRICEIGCGGGDNLKILANWCQNHKIKAVFTGIDINTECIRHAKNYCTGLEIDFITSDYRNVNFNCKPDIVFSSLFCHHFSDAALLEILRWMDSNSHLGFFINDLHRHPAAYYSIRLLTKLLSTSRLVKHDGPLSVLRGFVRKEWMRLLPEAGIYQFKLTWEWAFRWLVIVQKHPS